MSANSPLSAPALQIQTALIDSLARSTRRTSPYRFWLMQDVLPSDAAGILVELPLAPPADLVFNGRRETNNASRYYFNAEAQARFPVAGALAEALQAPGTVAAIERECGNELAGSNLRIEYCQDKEGFWLEPHTDIGVKRFTMSIYLCQGEDAATLGTDIYDDTKTLVECAPSPFNSAMLFIPGKTTYHGFRQRPIIGIRKSLIVNFVGPEWRAREELAYPETPVPAH